MKILMLNYEFPPIGGGAGMATFCLAEALTTMGHQVDVLTSGRWGKRPVETIRGIKVYRAMSLRKGVHDSGLRGAVTYMGCALPKLSGLIHTERYDIFHFFFSLPTGFFTLLPGGRHCRPYVVSLRGSDVPGYDPFNYRITFLHGLLKPVTRRIWKRSKHVVAVTNSLKKTALETFPCLDIKVIPNGVDVELFKPAPMGDNNRSVFKLICVSRLVKRKGIDQILNAMAALRDENIKLTIVGAGEYENALKEKCSALSLESKVEFMGFCRRDKLPDLYRASDAFILTSRFEAFGNVFAEAMACGLPVIGANVGGIPDLVSPKTGILIEPDDIEGIRDAILTLKNSRGLRETMGRASRHFIMQNYQWTEIASQFVQLYRS